MPSQIQYPTISGNRFAWASVEIKTAGRIFYATGINYSRKRNRQIVRVNHPDPVGKTIGTNEYQADIEMLLSEFNALQAELINQANQQGLNGGYGELRFDVIVQYAENQFDTVTDTIKACTMDSTEATGAESPDALKRKFELNPLKILFAGQDDMPNPLITPPGA